MILIGKMYMVVYFGNVRNSIGKAGLALVALALLSVDSAAAAETDSKPVRRCTPSTLNTVIPGEERTDSAGNRMKVWSTRGSVNDCVDAPETASSPEVPDVHIVIEARPPRRGLKHRPELNPTVSPSPRAPN